MVDIYTFVIFFRNFGANVLLEKNTLKSPAQGFYRRKVIKYVKNYVQLNFLCNLERLEPTYIHLKKVKNAIFAKMAICKWM